MLEPDCTLTIVLQHRRYRWWKKTQLATAPVVHSEVYDIVSLDTSPEVEWYKLPTAPNIELRLSPEDPLVSLRKIRQQFANRISAIENSFRKSQERLDKILKLASSISEINPVAQGAVGVIDVVFKELKKREARDNLVLDLLDDLSMAMEYVHRFPPGTLKRLEEYIHEVETMGTSVINLVQSYVAGSSSHPHKEFADLRSQLTKCMEKFKQGVDAESAWTSDLWTKKLEILLSDHYESFIRRRLPEVPEREHIPPCLPGTREGVLRKIRTWLKDENSSKNILWVKGYPGSGKSTIASTLVEKLRKESTGALASRFFFHRTSSESASPSHLHLWGTVASDFCKLDTLFGKAVVESLENKDLDPITDLPKDLFERLIEDPIKACESPRFQQPLFVVVDGLDECRGFGSNRLRDRNTVQDTLASVGKWAKLPGNFKLVVMSREHVTINRALENIHDSVELSLEDEESDSDIRRFLEDGCAQIAQDHESLGSQWPGKARMKALVARAGGLFVYATTLINYLGHNPETRLQHILSGALGPGGDLAALYHSILDNSFPAVDRLPDLVKSFKAVVGAMVLTTDPKAREAVILHLLHIRRDNLESICNGLQSVMDLSHANVLQFHHQSFVEYLVSDKTCPPVFQIDLASEKKKLTLKYFRALRKCLRFNIGKLKNPFMPNPAVAPMKAELTSHLVHASLVWGQHLDEVFWTDIEKEAKQFLNDYFLYWLEVLSLVGESGAAAKNLRSLETCITRSRNVKPSIVKFVKDALDFVKTFKQPIAYSAAHIYLSALSFTPPTSAIALVYDENFFRRTTSLSSHAPEENDIFRGEGTPGPITSLSSSPNGYIAIAALERIRVRDPFTRCNVIIPLHCDIRGVVMTGMFSPDGETIVTGAEDKTIRMWNANNGLPLYPSYSPGRHEAGVTSVIFLEDGKSVASGAKDGTISIWEANSGKRLATCTLYPDAPVTSMAGFSNNQFISISSHKTEFTILEFTGSKIELCGQLFQVRGTLTSIACSYGGPWIAAGSVDHGVHVWHMLNGQETVMSPFSGHSTTVTCVAVHNDCVASGGEDHTIILWDCATGHPLAGPFHGHSDTLTCLEFSRDGNLLFSGSKDGTVRMWDVRDLKTGSTASSDPMELGEDYGIDSQGWILDPDGTRLLWVPEVERKRMCWGRCRAIIDGEPWKHLYFLDSHRKAREHKRPRTRRTTRRK
ncbi:hypothetical protein B0H19DRAFT_1026780 [Mycena capillaripes]|nr:hypothetical protein B0H19DRAFT_1026780 [Mycena capillaripes]